MQAIDLLKQYQKRLNPFLEEYFQRKKKESKKIDELAVDSVNLIRKFVMGGGKRIRPALVYYGFLAAGGEDSDKIVKASMGIELIHSFLLMHDDIIDRDNLRHGIETIHITYRKRAQMGNFSGIEAEHFGNSMAMLLGDMSSSMGYEVIFNAEFAPESRIKALNKLQKIAYVTLPGEMVDVVLEAKGVATEQEIMRMYEGKTARYTFEGPLHLGAALAGAENGFYRALSGYAVPVGIAFQIRDDILGIFGEEDKLGKPIGSDIIEGKQTILVVKALELSEPDQKERISQLLGKKDLTMEEIEDFRKIIIDTGALDYANELSEELIGNALKALEKIEIKNQEAKFFLEGIAQFIIKRHH